MDVHSCNVAYTMDEHAEAWAVTDSRAGRGAQRFFYMTISRIYCFLNFKISYFFLARSARNLDI